MADGDLTFAAIEARLKAMPEGPVASFKSPKWIVWASAASTVALICALLPSLLIKFMTPQQWMVPLMTYGLLAGVVLGLPFFVRSLWLLLHGLSRWREEMAEQLDHDLGEFRNLTRWLGSFPRETLVEHQRMVRSTKIQLDSKLVVVAGGSHRLGVLPLVAAALSLFWGVEKNLLLPTWWAAGLIALVLAYWIALSGAQSVIRFQLYDSLLTDALDRKSRVD
jgi:hypothetical protein